MIMKHIKTFEGFVNEKAINEDQKTVAEWDAASSEIVLSGGLADPCGIRCEDGKIVAYCDSRRGGYINDLGIKCDPNTWKASGPDMIEELNANVDWLGGIVSKPVDNQVKKLVVEIIKSNI